MNTTYDIEKSNRKNFRASLEALSRPGKLQRVEPLFESSLMAMASVLLYAEVTYFYEGIHDFQIIRAVCGSYSAPKERADYLFFDSLAPEHLIDAKTGSAESPELGATLLFSLDTESLETTTVNLSGPGIDGELNTILPVSRTFIDKLCEKNESFPMGVDLFFIGSDNSLLGLPRTTHIEVVS